MAAPLEPNSCTEAVLVGARQEPSGLADLQDKSWDCEASEGPTQGFCSPVNVLKSHLHVTNKLYISGD